MITDANGKSDGNFYFRFGENTTVLWSCSMKYKNQFYVFDGTTIYGGDFRQISKLEGCSLQRIGTLAFDHYWGACTGVNDQRIYLCFDNYSSNVCRYAENPLDTFTEAASSVYDHRFTSIAASECEFKFDFQFV